MIGQPLALGRPDLVRALVLSNTASKLGDPAKWADRIAAINANGPTFRATPEAVP